MRYEITTENATTILKVIDEIVASDKEIFTTIIDKVVEPKQAIRIDMSELSYMDSAGLGFLLSLWQVANKTNLPASISGVTGEVKELLELSNFKILFTFE